MSNINDFKNKNTKFTGTSGIELPKGTTAERVNTQATVRFNTSTSYMEYYDGTSWTAVVPLPTITSASPSIVDPGDSTEQTFTITGANFDETSTATFIGQTTSVETSANSTGFVSSTELTVKISLPSDLQDYKVKVQAAAGAGISENAVVTASSAPTWTTSSGTLQTVYINSPISTSVAATADSDVTYSETTSVLTGTNTPSQMNCTLNSSTGAITGTSPSPSANSTTYNFTLRATDEESQTTDRQFSIVVERFTGGNQSPASMVELAQGILTASDTNVSSGGTLTLNSSSIGSYEYYKTSGTTTISSFSNSTYFSGSRDNMGSFLVFDGDTTVSSGVTIQPSQRKLYQAWYVNGDLTINGTISMKSRGANHNGSGNSAGYVAETTLALDGTNTVASNAAGNGGNGRPQGASGGSGASGTCFSGGPGGGGGDNGTGQPGTARGGQGGNGGGYNSSGGAGNPGGVQRASGHTGPSGTGGTVIIMATGNVSGSGSIVCRAYDGHGSGGHRGGGGSGGGVVKILAGGTASMSTNVNGGTGGVAGGGQGQPGASGTSQIVQGVSF